MPTDTTYDLRNCAHCGLPVPPDLTTEDLGPEVPRFCCNGCETVFALLADHDMTQYYALRDSDPNANREPAQVSGHGYSDFAGEDFRERYCRPLPDGRMSCDLYLEGVHCAACVWLLERLPRLAPGVEESRLQFRKSLLTVNWNPASIDLPAIARSLDQMGYRPHPARSDEARSARTREERSDLVRLAVAGACAGNAMLLAFALYAGEISGIDPLYQHAFRALSLCVAVISLGWPGAVFFRGAWAALRVRRSHMDIPVALGLAVGGISGLVATVTGRGDIYFDTLTVLVFLLLVGRYIQRRQQFRACDAVEMLFSYRSHRARKVLQDGSLQDVPAEFLTAGDLVELRGGDLCPADGLVEQGSSRIDESVLTGESRPVAVGVGDSICAGSQNISAPIRLRVTAAGEDTRVAKLMALVSDSSERRAPVVQLADRLAGWFVVTVIALAVTCLAIWLHAGLETATHRAVALLIVACPCALGMATPLAMTVALGRAARRQTLIKGADTLERLAQPGLILLDKTGTLTRGCVAVTDWTGDDSAQPLVVALENAANHPIATAIRAAWPDHGLTPSGVSHEATGGLQGMVDGHHVAAVSLAGVEALGLELDLPHRYAVTRAIGQGQTPVIVAVDCRVVGVAACGDALRDDARATLDALRQAGWEIGVLSGDHPAVVDHVASELGIAPARRWGGATPEDKLAVIQGLVDGEQRPVVMVGDGVNDAAALAAASVGIAVHGGAEASLAAADIYLSRPGLQPIAELIDRARQTMRVVRRGLAVSLAYNCLTVSLAMTGVLTPLIAAIIMPISSVTVITLALLGARREQSENPLVDSPALPEDANADSATPKNLRGATCP